jgi:tripartite-type tricarboxylate transporter receptor subunit TctC
MKNLIAIIFASVLATSAIAEPINIVNPGSEEGAFRQVLTTIGDKVEHNFVQANNPVTAYSYFDDKNILTIWSSEWPGDNTIKSPKITEDNIVALMTYETLICSREYKSLDELAGQQIKIATWGSEPVAKFLNALGKEIGAEFIVVPFSGSGSTTKGYIAGDANTVFTITTRQTALEEDKKTTCFAFSENGDLGFRFVDAIVTINVPSKITEYLRNVVDELRQTDNWKEKFNGTSTYIGNVQSMYDEAVTNFSK